MVQFLLLGAAIWLAATYWDASRQRYVIEIGVPQIKRIVAGYEQQFGVAPTAAQLDMVLARHVREEMAFREGLALGLDQDDEIVRRRVVQKYEFLQADLSVPVEPGVDELRRWFEANRSKYVTPRRVGFSHLYFSPDDGGDETAQARAQRAHMALSKAGPDDKKALDLGDPFPGPAYVSDAGEAEAERLFGRTDVARQLMTAPLGQWAGPHRSGFGWHLVYVMHQTPSAVLAFEEIEDRLRADYAEEHRRLGYDRLFEQMQEKYTVHYKAEQP